MSTRCNIVVKDEYSCIQLYRHCDGYPEGEHGVIHTLQQALDFAWELPRTEADDMAAAIIRAWKESGGGNIYIDGTHTGRDSLHGDIEYLYVIEAQNGKWRVIVKDFHENGCKRGYIGQEFEQYEDSPI